MKPAAAYARFSSDNQREESIDAQIRAIKYFASQYGYDIIKVYADKAISGRTADRPQFLKMMQDSEEGMFKAVIVHKLDRFSRDSTDMLVYERTLKFNGVELVSVNEKLDNTPEGSLMKMIIAGMNEFYSKNLAREVMKGLKENAYNCKHTGGIAPLGYDVAPDKTYTINIREAEAVKIIFEMYAAGYGYGSIIDQLNLGGYKTKLGKSFGKNSLHEVLRNEKYSGIYVYNKAVSKDIRGKYNRHKYKDDNDIIRIRGGIPAIVSEELQREVLRKMENNKRKNGQHKAKNVYLLSGLIACGECGGSMTGETRRYRDKEYAYYCCTTQKRTGECDKKPVQRDILEKNVIDMLNRILFNPKNIKSICKRIYESYQKDDKGEQVKAYHKEVESINSRINNIYKAVEMGLNIEESMKRINMLSDQKNAIQIKICELESIPEAKEKTADELMFEFKKYADLAKLSPQEKKSVLNRFIQKILIYTQDPETVRVKIIVNPNNERVSDLLDMNGGEGGIRTLAPR